MFDKDLFDRICNAGCSREELEKFVIDIDKKEFDSENPFEKYYNVERLIMAIEKYEAKEIDAKFLASWMNAYNRIIMGGYKTEEQDESVSLKKYMIWEIADWIDGLAFFDGNEDIYNLKEYKKRFRVFDTILQDLTQCNAEYAPLGYDERGVIVFITNDDAKYFMKVFGELDYEKMTIDFENTAAVLLADRERKLLDAGYKELKYRNFTEEELL